MILPYIDNKTVEDKEKLNEFIQSTKFIIDNNIPNLDFLWRIFRAHQFIVTYSKQGATVYAGASQYGDVVSFSADDGYYCLIPYYVKVTCPSGIGPGVSLAVKLTVVFDDNTSYDLIKSVSNSSTSVIYPSLQWTYDIATAFKSGANVVRLDVSAGSNASGVTISPSVAGFQFRG